jgi:spermidine synthase
VTDARPERGGPAAGARSAEPAAESPARGGAPALLATAALAGAGTMAVELAAVRLLAPWFGASQAVWTSVIGVVLLALALGYAGGARAAADHGDAPQVLARGLRGALVGAALWVGILPWLAGPLAELLVPRVTALDEAPSLLTWSSLVASLVLFLPPAALLGTVSPVVTELLARRTGQSAGTVGGRVLACSTLGSLVGVFGTTHVLIAHLGLPWTFGTAALLLGLPILFLGGRPLTAALVTLAGPGLAWTALQDPAHGALPDGSRLLAQVESPYQRLRVLETGEGESLRRWLAANEASDSFQSVWIPRAGLLGSGHYYDAFALPVAWARPDDSNPAPWRLLVLGLGAGTTIRVLEGCLGDPGALDWRGVELDPEVVRLGVEWFELKEGSRAVAGLDARVALRLEPDASWDQVVVDCYANNMEVPAHLATLELFLEARRVLREGGWISVNAGGFGLEDPVVQAVGRTLATALGSRVLAVEVPFSRNVALIGRKAGQVPEPGSLEWATVAVFAETLTRAWGAPGTWAWLEPAQAPLTDAHAPLEHLQRASVRAGRRRWAVGDAGE